jgi:hypothetical protein
MPTVHTCGPPCGRATDGGPDSPQPISTARGAHRRARSRGARGWRGGRPTPSASVGRFTLRPAAVIASTGPAAVVLRTATTLVIDNVSIRTADSRCGGRRIAPTGRSPPPRPKTERWQSAARDPTRSTPQDSVASPLHRLVRPAKGLNLPRHCGSGMSQNHAKVARRDSEWLHAAAVEYAKKWHGFRRATSSDSAVKHQ